MAIDSPDKIRAAQLISAKYAIALEAKGLRHSKIKGGAKGSWAKHYDMPPKSSHLEVIQRIQREIDELNGRIFNDQIELPLRGNTGTVIVDDFEGKETLK